MDTGRYEAESRKHLREKAEMAEQEQESFLFDVLRRQSDTVYGREHDFASLRSLEVFQDTLPFTEFSDMEPYMQREVAGERGVLLSEKPYFFCISSGSTGAPKYLPIGREDAALQHLYLDGAIPAMIEEKISPGRRCRFATTDVFRTFMEDGTLSGVRSGMSANLALEEGRFPFLEYYAPREVLFPGTLSDMSYVKLRFALDRGDITSLEGVFVNSLVSLLRYMLSHWEELLFDMERGTVGESFAIGERWKRYIEERLPPNPERARYLRGIWPGQEEGLLSLIWPELRYVSTICGMQFVPYGKILRRLSGHLPVHSFAYAASEGFIGIAYGMDMSGTYILLPDTCFYEFISEEGSALLLSEVCLGRRYELAITTRSGLYRYRTGDVVEVVGFYRNTPLIRVCYRKDLVISIVDEKYNALQFDEAMEEFFRRCHLTSSPYCVRGDYEGELPRYKLYIETKEELPERAEEVLEEMLEKMSLAYSTERQMQEIGPAHIALLQEGSFSLYEKKLLSRGLRREQRKPLRIVNKEKDILFFEGRVKR